VAKFDPKSPAIARVYDYLLGGKTNFAADRAMAEQLIALVPETAAALRDNKEFLTRAATWVANQGIEQFVDLGSGLPTPPTTHGTVRAVRPGARVTYVDNDPVVYTHLSELLAKDRAVRAFAADFGDLPAVMAAITADSFVNFDRPACVMLGSVLHFYPFDEAQDLVRAYLAPLVPGSYLVMSVAVPVTEAAAEAVASYQASGRNFYPYTDEQVAALFDHPALKLVAPGVTRTRRWHANWTDLPPVASRGADLLGGVARVTG
jgi:S-adenosyl methyltransferase